MKPAPPVTSALPAPPSETLPRPCQERIGRFGRFFSASWMRGSRGSSRRARRSSAARLSQPAGPHVGEREVVAKLDDPRLLAHGRPERGDGPRRRRRERGLGHVRVDRERVGALRPRPGRRGTSAAPRARAGRRRRAPRPRRPQRRRPRSCRAAAAARLPRRPRRAAGRTARRRPAPSRSSPPTRGRASRQQPAKAAVPAGSRARSRRTSGTNGRTSAAASSRKPTIPSSLSASTSTECARAGVSGLSRSCR